jgi:hypothetical protein
MDHEEAPISDNDATDVDLMSDETAVETANIKKRKKTKSDGYDSEDDDSEDYDSDDDSEEMEELVLTLEEEGEAEEMFVLLQNLY